MSAKVKVGFGFDVHQLVEGRPFVLGGVTIPHEKGLLGHSDADALLHAICDALLGAAGLEDIGTHFPDTDEKYKNIDSKILYRETLGLITQKGFKIGNIDATVVLEKPKLKPFIPQLRKSISELSNIEITDVTVKATTNEKMGFIGRKEGVAVYAVCLLYV
ncbi:MAG: 2-C-methyl-D-erythritol 2,4-cyclodiphosphate synthase [Chitinophagaceae bacterium]|nr:MAG: 2-C-methyl-D-erythritol 2,4-cyclodiphosphate synthase [Chitinophagaceae bacterium]